MRRILRILAAAVLAALVLQPMAQERAAREQEIKAAFLFKFLSFVEWPAQAAARPGAPLIIGFMGAHETAADLQQIASARTIQGRPIAVRPLRVGEPLGELQMLFVGAEHSARLPQISKAAQARGILLVSESDAGLDLGSVINFVVAQGRVRFEVNLDAAERSGLRISSRMLAVASEVRPARP